MQFINILRKAWFVAMFCLLLWQFPGIVHGEETGEEYYRKGLISYSHEKWTEAEQYFLKSNEAVPAPIKDYMLSCVYLKLGKPKETLDYAQRALNGNPQLEEPYKTGAQENKEWAKSSLSSEGKSSTRKKRYKAM